MAAFTSKATGNWSASGQTTWNEVGVPGNGDTVTIQNTHTVTVDVSTTIGTSPAEGNVVVQINTGGAISIATGVTFTVRGDIRSANAGITMAAGSVLEFDASASGAPSTTNYEWQMGTSAGGNARLTANGTSGSHCIVRSNSGGGPAFIRWGQASGFQAHYTCTYTDFIRMNNPSNNRGIEVAPNTGTTGDISFTNCTFDADCGAVYFASALSSTTNFTVSGCSFLNTQGTQGLRILATAPAGAQTRLIENSIFSALLYGIEGSFTVQDCVLDGGYDHSNANTWTDLNGCYIRVNSASGVSIRGNVTDCFWLADGFNDNPHIVIPRDVGASKTISGCVLEFTGTVPTDSGNWFYGVGTWVVQYNIILKAVSASGNHAAGDVTPAGGSGAFSVYHNTCYAPGDGGILLGDGGAAAGQIPNCKSNLFWTENGVSAIGVVAIGDATTTDNVLTPGNCTHNGFVNPHATRYQGDYPTTQPGANDVTVTGDPPFVDETRNIASWAVTQGSVSGTYAGKVSDARGYLRADRTLIASLLAHVRDGFAPTDEALRDAGHDGVTIGAVEMAAASGNRRRRAIICGAAA